MDISVVVPLLNEAESLPELVSWIQQVMVQQQFSYEILLIDDGSTDESWNVIKKLSAGSTQVRGIRFQRNYGKSAALNVGFKAAQGDIVITMDADLQDSPDEIPALVNMIRSDGYQLVSGWKHKRYDPLTKTIPTKLFNWVTRRMSGIRLHDFNCGLKAYRRDVVKSVQVYGEMHRYVPVLAKWSGFQRIGEKKVQHQARKYGYSKFGLDRFLNGFLDLLTIFFMGKFGKRPMHFFGTLGVFSITIGFLILLYLSLSKIFWDATGIADRPLFYFGIITLLVGTQLFLTGFLAELVGRSSPHRDEYHIAETTGSH